MLKDIRYKNLLSLLFGIVFIFLLYFYLREKELLKNISDLCIIDYIYSFIFLIISFFLSGFQLRLAIKKATSKTISLYDTFTLPMVQNVWGFIIPIQGSFIYGSTYLKLKYKIDVNKTFSLYLFLIMASSILGSIVGMFVSYSRNIFLFFIFIFIFISPIILFLVNDLILKFNFNNKLISKLHQLIVLLFDSILFMYKDKYFLIKIIAIEILYVLNFAIWSSVLSEALSNTIPIYVFLVTGFFMKLTLLAKFTPGNVGITQLFFGGVFILFAADPAVGVLISTYQLSLLIVLIFPLSIFFSFVNLYNKKKTH